MNKAFFSLYNTDRLPPSYVYFESSAIHAAFEYTITNYYVLFEDKVCWSQY